MKKILLISFVLLTSVVSVNAQTLSYLKYSTFKPGETLQYKLKYGIFTAAEATIKVLDTDVKFDGKPTYHLSVDGSTSGSFDIFYKVRNRYDSYIDEKNFTPYLYTENIREEKYRRNDKARFYQEEQKVVSNKGNFKSPVEQTFDLVSAYYFARNLDLSGIKQGEKLTLNYFLDDEIAPLTIEYIGKETIETDLGEIRCLKFSPSIKPGRIFRKDSKLYLWITDDGNRIPVKAEVEVLLGSVTMEIKSVEGLRQPLQAGQ
jgi:hypothetical protein